MRIVLVDTGRSRGASNVEAWRVQLDLELADEVALVSWLPPAAPLPVVDQMVFGPTLEWGRREPVRPKVTRPRRAPLPTNPSVWHLRKSDPRRVAAAVARRRRRVWTAITARLGVDPLQQVRSDSRVGKAVRRRLGVSSDGIATDFAIAVARSQHVLGLARWADVIVPVDPKSRKAAWVLTRRAPGPKATIDLNSAIRVIKNRRRTLDQATRDDGRRT